MRPNEPHNEDQKFRKFYIEWWNVRKSTIYTLVVTLVLIIFGGGFYLFASHQNWFSKTGVESDATNNTAKIIAFEGDVRVTRAATRETVLVTREIYVGAGDTIQTQGDGRATIQMIDGSTYTVRPNSTVVVRDSSSYFGGKNIRVSLDDGQLNVKTQQSDNAQNVVEVAESETKVMPETDASFNADAQTNNGEIRITRGGVETTLGGQTTTIHENEYASVDNGQLSAREKLLDPPKQTGPANLTQIPDSTGAGGNVALTWQANSAAGYYLQVSRSPYFSPDSILVDKSNMPTAEFRVGGLSPGTYYWRVKSTAKSGQTTEWNEPWKFQVVKSDSGKSIDVTEWRTENIGGNVYLITGRTQPGLAVRTQGREPTYAGSDGTFRLQLTTPSAVTAIEISDDRGNHTGFVLSLQTAKVVRKY